MTEHIKRHFVEWTEDCGRLSACRGHLALLAVVESGPNARRLGLLLDGSSAGTMRPIAQGAATRPALTHTSKIKSAKADCLTTLAGVLAHDTAIRELLQTGSS